MACPSKGFSSQREVRRKAGSCLWTVRLPVFLLVHLRHLCIQGCETVGAGIWEGLHKHRSHCRVQRHRPLPQIGTSLPCQRTAQDAGEFLKWRECIIERTFTGLLYSLSWAGSQMGLLLGQLDRGAGGVLHCHRVRRLQVRHHGGTERAGS